jgi:hypothetical protein
VADPPRESASLNRLRSNNAERVKPSRLENRVTKPSQNCEQRRSDGCRFPASIERNPFFLPPAHNTRGPFIISFDGIYCSLGMHTRTGSGEAFSRIQMVPGPLVVFIVLDRFSFQQYPKLFHALFFTYNASTPSDMVDSRSFQKMKGCMRDSFTFSWNMIRNFGRTDVRLSIKATAVVLPPRSSITASIWRPASAHQQNIVLVSNCKWFKNSPLGTLR